MPECNKTGKNIGINLGIKDFCVASDGMVEANPKYWKKSLDKLAKLQKRLSRKTKGSSNRNKARMKFARLHEKIANQKKDLKVRKWICPQCNTYQDRDLHASINILNEELKILALNN